MRTSPAIAAWVPIYQRKLDGAVHLGLLASSAHVNSRGFVHGGVLAALADNAMGYSCAERVGGDAAAALVTTNLAIDYLAPVPAGAWVTFETTFVSVRGILAVAQAFVKADEVICGRASATFRISKQQLT